MVSYLRHYTAAFVIFALIVTLYGNIFIEVEDAYNLTRTGDVNGSNVMESIQNINIIQAMDGLTSAIYTIANPTNTFDLLGAMALAGIGILKTIASIVLLPIEIFGVITGFYYIPPIVVTSLIVLSFVYVGFILLSAWMKERI